MDNEETNTEEVVDNSDEQTEEHEIADTLVGLGVLTGVGAISFYAGKNYERARDALRDRLAVRRARKSIPDNVEALEVSNTD